MPGDPPKPTAHVFNSIPPWHGDVPVFCLLIPGGIARGHGREFRDTGPLGRRNQGSAGILPGSGTGFTPGGTGFEVRTRHGSCRQGFRQGPALHHPKRHALHIQVPPSLHPSGPGGSHRGLRNRASGSGNPVVAGNRGDPHHSGHGDRHRNRWLGQDLLGRRHFRAASRIQGYVESDPEAPQGRRTAAAVLEGMKVPCQETAA